jgi:hypothetical protein
MAAAEKWRGRHGTKTSAKKSSENKTSIAYQRRAARKWRHGIENMKRQHNENNVKIGGIAWRNNQEARSVAK